MIYRELNGNNVSTLGFGTMRLPMTEDGHIDEAKTSDMIKLAIDNGVNYFDTAYPYHGGEAEPVLGRILKQYPRDSYYLATKYPGHQIAESFNPAETFEEQLTKCGVDYFDYYLLHNVYENSIDTYMDPRWGIVEYFKEQKKLGRIKKLGFSIHGSLEIIRKFLDYCGKDMDFCQIQLNYLDWTLQKGKEKYELLTEYGLPIIVMEPVRGGKLAKLSDENEALLRKLNPDTSTASWAFRFLQGLPNVKVILSGMSDEEQVKDNLKTFEIAKSLSDEENAVLMKIADDIKNTVPCTACRYCCDDCPQGIDIPLMMDVYNDLSFSMEIGVAMRLEGFPEDKQPAACINCGKCARLCPQSINIPEYMKALAEMLGKIPKWVDICRQRDEA